MSAQLGQTDYLPDLQKLVIGGIERFVIVDGLGTRFRLRVIWLIDDIRTHLAQEPGSFSIFFRNRPKIEYDAVLKPLYRLHQFIVFGAVKHDGASKWWFCLPRVGGREPHIPDHPISECP